MRPQPVALILLQAPQPGVDDDVRLVDIHYPMAETCLTERRDTMQETVDDRLRGVGFRTDERDSKFVAPSRQRLHVNIGRIGDA